LQPLQDSLESLPGDLRRNFTLMHDLDVKNKNILREVDSASDEYLRKVRELSPGNPSFRLPTKPFKTGFEQSLYFVEYSVHLIVIIARI